MNETIIIVAAVVGIAIVLSTLVFIVGRLKIEQQRTLQKLLEKDDDSIRPEWSQALGAVSRRESDFRRGMLLTVLGLALTGLLAFVGGIGWMLGLLPVTVGTVYLFFWMRNGSDR